MAIENRGKSRILRDSVWRLVTGASWVIFDGSVL